MPRVTSDEHSSRGSANGTLAANVGCKCGPLVSVILIAVDYNGLCVIDTLGKYDLKQQQEFTTAQSRLREVVLCGDALN